MEKTSVSWLNSELLDGLKEMLLSFFLICKASGNSQPLFRIIEREKGEGERKRTEGGSRREVAITTLWNQPWELPLFGAQAELILLALKNNMSMLLPKYLYKVVHQLSKNYVKLTWFLD